MRKFKFTIQGNQYEVEVKSFEENTVQIEVNGTAYEVEVHKQLPTTKTPTLVRTPVKPPEGAQVRVVSGMTEVRSPLPGNVLQVVRKNGDTVKKGDLVITYEAMKMENKILAERDGVIRNLKLNPGDSFLQNDILFEIE